jgi:hypothetical protein
MKAAHLMTLLDEFLVYMRDGHEHGEVRYLPVDEVPKNAVGAQLIKLPSRNLWINVCYDSHTHIEWIEYEKAKTETNIAATA